MRKRLFGMARAAALASSFNAAVDDASRELGRQIGEYALTSFPAARPANAELQQGSLP